MIQGHRTPANLGAALCFQYLLNSVGQSQSLLPLAHELSFVCLTKKVIKRAAMKYNRDISRRLKHEVPFSEISDLELNKAGVYDKYSSDYTAFNVLGMEVQVSDDQLSKALKCLPERKRNIILLSYFMDMSDAEIGELMNVVRTTVYRHRTSTLEELRKMMEEE